MTREERGQRRRATRRKQAEVGPKLSRAQRRYLNVLLAMPDFRGTGGRQPQTRRALLRAGVIREDGKRDRLNVQYDGHVWRWV